MSAPIDDRHEWLEVDGLGGFASGTSGLVRTRRYHALLLAAVTPPTGRVVLVNGFDAAVETPSGSTAISAQRYQPNVIHPDGISRLRSFSVDPWPTWTFDLPGGGLLKQEILVEHGAGTTLVSWTIDGRSCPATLAVRPWLSGRDYHATHHENGAFVFTPETRGAVLTFRPYPGLPPIVFLTSGTYRHAPDWYRQFLYREEAERGLDSTEDLAAPGEICFELTEASPRAVWMMSTREDMAPRVILAREALNLADEICERERRRRLAFPTPLDRAADAYLVRRRGGRTIVAGYPWFTDWGRDTFIALRGLYLATGRLIEARDILLEWADTVSEGMLPNRFPDAGDGPEFNAVDASLWYVIAARELLDRAVESPGVVSAAARRTLERACRAIVDGYAAGTRFGIRMDEDGLLMAGVPGVQLTWMDARVGERVITPRIGKPVEVQALWINALHAVGGFDARRLADAKRATASFGARFWNPERSQLADVVDVNHVAGTRDDTFRPNQIFAVGGLPVSIVPRTQGRAIVDAVQATLLTPLGLRSLAPGEAGYTPKYEGDGATRDAAYHQGTVWPWLLGPFVEAWVRVRLSTPAAKRAARSTFIEPLLAHLDEAGLGHVSEIADGEPPFTPRGCPFQAWSLGELLRLDRTVLAVPGAAAPRRDVAADRPTKSR